MKKFYENSEQVLRNEIYELKAKLDKSNVKCQEANEKLSSQEQNFNETMAKTNELIKSLELNLIETNELLELAILDSNSQFETPKEHLKVLTADYEKQISELNSFIATTDLVIENLMKEKCAFEKQCSNFSIEINQLKESELKLQQETICFN